MLKEECVESESVEAWCRQGRGREWSSGVAVWWSCVLIELGAVRVVEHKMKKPVSSKRFLLAATIVAIGFVIFFGQQSALPSHFEYINAKATKPDVQPLAVLDTVEEPQEIQNSSMNHKHSTVNPIDSFPAGELLFVSKKLYCGLKDSKNGGYSTKPPEPSKFMPIFLKSALVHLKVHRYYGHLM